MPKSLFFLLSQLVTLQNTHTYTHTLIIKTLQNTHTHTHHHHHHHQNPLNMLRDQIIPSTSRNGHDLDQNHEDDDHELIIRDIHALAPPLPPPPNLPRQREAWETSSHTSLGSTESENFTTMSREFNALVIAGNTLESSENEGGSSSNNNNNSNLGRIGEEEMLEETNPLAIVADTNPMYPVASPSPGMGTVSVTNSNQGEVTVQRVKKEEVESKISAWQNAKIAKINNRFKREDAIINGWEGGHVQKSTSWMKKVERKLEEKRAKALEKMQNDIAKARRKAEERRATAEAKRGTKVARVLEIANLMRAVGRAPAKRSFF